MIKKSKQASDTKGYHLIAFCSRRTVWSPSIPSLPYVTGAIEKGKFFVSFRKFVSLYSGAPEMLVGNRATC